MIINETFYKHLTDLAESLIGQSLGHNLITSAEITKYSYSEMTLTISYINTFTQKQRIAYTNFSIDDQFILIANTADEVLLLFNVSYNCRLTSSNVIKYYIPQGIIEKYENN